MLTKTDALHLPDHYYLDREDECYFIGEYTKGKGYAHSATNQLIYNLKKSVLRKPLPDYWYKTDAILRAALALSQRLNPEFVAHGTFVPVPPSKSAADPLYDDRITQIIRSLGPNVDVREIVRQIVSRPEAHLGLDRPDPQELYNNYEIDKSLLEPIPSSIAVVDDVLTTGAHFKAMQRILLEAFPDARVVGLFLARRVPETE